MFESGKFYDCQQVLPALGEKKISRPILYGLIASAFPPLDIIKDSLDFTDEAIGYSVGENRRHVAVEVAAEQVRLRLSLICDILTGLSSRTDDLKPVFPISVVYHAFSVIACNWISIHGCLGTDGHGRATMQLLPITLGISGYPNEFVEKQFRDASGNFDINKSLFALGYLNGHILDGARIIAAGLELDRCGKVSDILLDRAIIWDAESRMKATRHAAFVISGFKNQLK
jgi:hypothetical protein